MRYLLKLSSSANSDTFGCPNCQKTVFWMSKWHAGRRYSDCSVCFVPGTARRTAVGVRTSALTARLWSPTTALSARAATQSSPTVSWPAARSWTTSSGCAACASTARTNRRSAVAPCAHSVILPSSSHAALAGATYGELATLQDNNARHQ